MTTIKRLTSGAQQKCYSPNKAFRAANVNLMVEFEFATSADNEPQKKSGMGVFFYEHVYLLLAHNIEHWRLTDAVGPACLLLSPWQRAPVHADGRCDGEGGLERGRLRVRLHR